MSAPWGPRPSRFNLRGWWNVTRKPVTNMKGYLAFTQQGAVPVPNSVPAPMSSSGITIPGPVFALGIMMGDLL